MTSDSDSKPDTTTDSESNGSQVPAAEEPRASDAGRGSGADGGPQPASAGDPADASAATPDEPPETAEEQLAKMRERLLRTAADYDNYRKRARRDVAEAERRVQEDLVRALLPTFDNVERAAVHAESAADAKSIAEGLQMVMRQFRDTLGGLGIERVESMGNAFDPAEHEAVQHLVTDEVPPGVVTQELQAGYRWQGRLVRPALVVVAKAPPSAPETDAE